MKQFCIVDGRHAIDLNEVQWVEFYETPVTSDDKYRVKMLFKGSDVYHMDIPKREFDKLAQKIRNMGDDRIC